MYDIWRDDEKTRFYPRVIPFSLRNYRLFVVDAVLNRFIINDIDFFVRNDINVNFIFLNPIDSRANR
jgi:hypothetical protein